MKKNTKKNSGYITLISTLIIGAIGLSIALSLLLRSVSSVKTEISKNQSFEARMLADACAERALQEIWNSDFYEGNGNLSFGNGNCSYVVSGLSLPKMINAIGTVGTVVRKISITVSQLHPYVQVDPWLEVE